MAPERRDERLPEASSPTNKNPPTVTAVATAEFFLRTTPKFRPLPVAAGTPRAEDCGVLKKENENADETLPRQLDPGWYGLQEHTALPNGWLSCVAISGESYYTSIRWWK